MLWRDLSGCTTLFLSGELSGRDAADAAEDTCEVWLVGEAALLGYLSDGMLGVGEEQLASVLYACVKNIMCRRSSRQKVEELQRKCHRILGCMK